MTVLLGWGWGSWEGLIARGWRLTLSGPEGLVVSDVLCRAVFDTHGKKVQGSIVTYFISMYVHTEKEYPRSRNQGSSFVFGARLEPGSITTASSLTPP